jgi:ribosome maturation factor RimP
MIDKKAIVSLSEAFLKESKNYLIEVQVSASNKIKVFIDNDEHVAIKDCIALSRHIEQSLDREKEDFELEVSSPGIDQAFKHVRQYLKYISKPVEVLFLDGTKLTGTLDQISENEIIILPASQGKINRKITQTLQNNNMPKRISFAEIKEARPVVIF